MYQVYPGMNFPRLLAIFQVWYIMPCRKAKHLAEFYLWPGFRDVKSLTQDLAATHQKIQDLGFQSVQLNKLAETSMG